MNRKIVPMVRGFALSAAVFLATDAFAVRLQNDSGLFSATNEVATPASVAQVVSSGDYNATQTCDKLFDGVNNTVAGCWYGTYAVSNMWCAYTFDTATVIDAFKIVNGCLPLRANETARVVVVVVSSGNQANMVKCSQYGDSVNNKRRL